MMIMIDDNEAIIFTEMHQQLNFKQSIYLIYLLKSTGVPLYETIAEDLQKMTVNSLVSDEYLREDVENLLFK